MDFEDVEEMSLEQKAGFTAASAGALMQVGAGGWGGNWNYYNPMPVGAPALYGVVPKGVILHSPSQLTVTSPAFKDGFHVYSPYGYRSTPTGIP